MKCVNPNCGGEWTPPSGKSITVCPFCQKPITKDKIQPQYLDNVVSTLVYIKDNLGVDTLLGEKTYIYFADLTRNLLNDEAELIKQLCSKGALGCLKVVIGKSDSEHELAIRRALSKLPKYLQDSPSVTDMLFDFATALDWTIRPHTDTPQHGEIFSVPHKKNNTGLKITPRIGSIVKIANMGWRVLDIENNKALLISEKIIKKLPYNVIVKDISWENCTIRKYLNSDFIDKLEEIKSAITETTINNLNNQWYGTTGGNLTKDKVFLLSLDEVCRYFGDSMSQLRNVRKNNWYFKDHNNTNRIAVYEGEKTWWWLRSPGYMDTNATYVHDNGAISCYGISVDSDWLGVRPALWLNLNFQPKTSAKC
jgi:hypothetical protein